VRGAWGEKNSGDLGGEGLQSSLLVVLYVEVKIFAHDPLAVRSRDRESVVENAAVVHLGGAGKSREFQPCLPRASRELADQVRRGDPGESPSQAADRQQEEMSVRELDRTSMIG